jgi:ABC-2 type transport system ATP-binding protein
MDPRAATATETVPLLIEAQALSISYGAVRALDRLSMRVSAGSVGLLGSNGAGKTTLIRAMLGFSRRHSGRLRVLGHDVASDPFAVRSRTGYMPDGDSYIAGLTAVELVAFAGQLAGLRSDQAIGRAHEVLDLVGLDEVRYREADGFSLGTRQRLKLAQALVHDPELLLLDEPTSGLDPSGREEMLDLLCDVTARLNLSLVLSSHLLPDVERVCDSVVVIESGRLLAQGRLEHLLTSRDRAAYDVQLVGDPDEFVAGLTSLGASSRTVGDGLRVYLPKGCPPTRLFGLARASTLRIESLRAAVDGLDDWLAGVQVGPLSR